MELFRVALGHPQRRSRQACPCGRCPTSPGLSFLSCSLSGLRKLSKISCFAKGAALRAPGRARLQIRGPWSKCCCRLAFATESWLKSKWISLVVTDCEDICVLSSMIHVLIHILQANSFFQTYPSHPGYTPPPPHYSPNHPTPPHSQSDS